MSYDDYLNHVNLKEAKPRVRLARFISLLLRQRNEVTSVKQDVDLFPFYFRY